MNLTYKILWVEDDVDWASSIEESIKNIIEEYGFEPQMDRIATQKQGLGYKDYDLILMDYDLDNATGADIIKEVRKLEILTDVVFYSEKKRGELNKSVEEGSFEGIYYADREKTQFLEKVRRVIQSTIKKFLDLNNLRGLVMAEVSELDYQMEEIMREYYDSDYKLNDLRDHVIKPREKDLRANLSCTSGNCMFTWRNDSIDDIIRNNRIDSSQKAHAIHRVLKNISSKNKKFDILKFKNRYDAEIINVRNNLAHCVSIRNGTREEILKTKSGDKTYSGEDFKKILQNISRYHKIFGELLEYVKNQK